MRSWKIKKQNDDAVRALCRALRCTHFFARILINRGIDSVDKARDFLRVDRNDLYDPFMFHGMEQAVQRIGRSLRDRERITVYGDYDVDGITATGLLVEVLRELGGTVDYYIPSRFTEGYGVNSEAIRSIFAKGTKLMITVDTGITAVREVEEAKSLGMDVIITDHHECQSELPDTLILNPKYSESGYPFADLAGVGVVYKLVCALDQRFGHGDIAERYISFAAVGTIADIMPMLGENRYIVRQGLKKLKNTDCIGLKTMIDRCVGDRPIDTSTIGFAIAPRINAAGRMGDACTGVDLLTTRSADEAERLVDDLCKENNNRQGIENRILEEAIEMIESDPRSSERNAIVLWGEEWHNGVVGIVASRLKDRYGKPCILFSVNEGHAKGSGRSVRPFNLFESLERLSDKVERFGGHAFAAGVLVETARLEEFRDAFCLEVDRFLQEGEFDESIEVDCTVHESDITLEHIRDLSRLAPFGRGNETPVFCMRNVYLQDAASTANGNHMRLIFQLGHSRITGFYFNMPPAAFCYRAGDRVDIVFEADINTYNGRQSVQLLLKDVRYSEEKGRKISKVLRRIRHGELRREDVPGRAEAAALYRYLQKHAGERPMTFDFYTLPDRILRDQHCEVSVGALYHALKILGELGVLSYTEEANVFSNLSVHSERKVHLEDSRLLNDIVRKAGASVCV